LFFKKLNAECCAGLGDCANAERSS